MASLTWITNPDQAYLYSDQPPNPRIDRTPPSLTDPETLPRVAWPTANVSIRPNPRGPPWLAQALRSEEPPRVLDSRLVRSRPPS